MNGSTRYTPNNITELEPNELFVFGSNLEGHHDGGAARVALEKFGAIYGKGVGLQGQSYAIPTMGGLLQIRMYALDFLRFVKDHPELTFYLTKVGCGIAGHKEADIIQMFQMLGEMPNLIKPEGWDKYNKAAVQERLKELPEVE